jgi:lipopolysaccharide export system protein LptA
MKKKNRQLQIFLVLAGFFLFIITYIYYPANKEDMFVDKKSTKNELQKMSDEKHTTSFENMEYVGLYDFDKPFNVKSESAYILNDEPDIVYMKNMDVVLYLKNDRVVRITSRKGLYNKINYNCYFENQVIATDGDTKITADNLDLIATENFVEIYNNVSLDYVTGYLQADKIDYNFDTKNFKVSMFSDKDVKMKVIQ